MECEGLHTNFLVSLDSRSDIFLGCKKRRFTHAHDSNNR